LVRAVTEQVMVAAAAAGHTYGRVQYMLVLHLPPSSQSGVVEEAQGLGI
jgi:hypothetical protein